MPGSVHSGSRGPDVLGGRVLKVSAAQLCAFFSLFAVGLDIHLVPRSWKMSVIMPVPKKAGVRQLNDFRQVALTSVIAKSMQRLVCNQLITSVVDRMDLLQFAYRAGRGVEDATLTVFNLISGHLDTLEQLSLCSLWIFHQLSIQFSPMFSLRSY